MKKVVCIGGGNAMPKVVLEGIKKYPLHISVISGMLDSGGSSGRLRKQYKTVSPGDIRRAFVSLSNVQDSLKEVFGYRFNKGELKGHNLGNLIIMAMWLTGNKNGLENIHRLLGIKHKVLPSTLDFSNIYARLENGKIIAGETNIDVAKHDGNLKIKKVFLKPKPKAFPETIKEIKKADMIVFGPGDLYSSLIQILLVEGISEAIRKSKAKKLYIANLMTKYGETNDYTIKDFSDKVEEYLGSNFDFVLCNDKFDKKVEKAYKKKYPVFLEQVKINEGLDSKKYILKSLIKKDLIEHDPNKVAKQINKILCGQ